MWQCTLCGPAGLLLLQQLAHARARRRGAEDDERDDGVRRRARLRRGGRGRGLFHTCGKEGGERAVPHLRLAAADVEQVAPQDPERLRADGAADDHVALAAAAGEGGGERISPGVWGGAGRCGEVRRDAARCGEMRGDAARSYVAMVSMSLEIWGDAGRCGEM